MSIPHGTPTTLAIVGAGSRGAGYARRAIAQGAQITAVVEPDPVQRAAFLEEFADQPIRVLSPWQALAATNPRVAEAAVVATPDDSHFEPALALIKAGYHLLLEKPMAQTEQECVAIVDAADKAGVLLAVCHVMRYSDYTTKLKELIDAGVIGDIASVEHLEPIGWWHFAHSYVRGNWRREAESSSMLMAKSCHDLDWLSHVIGRPVTKVSSFGSLLHFRPEHKPANATDRCLDCPLQDSCAYSAPRIYRAFLGDPVHEIWPLAVLTKDLTPEGLDAALATGPYGECVYNGRNDVVDHQVVALEYEGGVTASFTVTAFTELDFRKTRIFGTHGWIEGDGRDLRVQEFDTGRTYTVHTFADGNASAADGHGGADDALVTAFLEAVRTGNRDLLLSGPEDSLASHRVVWAAERARKEGTVVSMPGGH